MLRRSLSIVGSTGTTTRLVAFMMSVALIGGCDPDAASPVAPDAQLEAGTLDPVVATTLAAHEPTNIQFGDFALHVPGNVHRVRGVLVALGGPDTRGYALGTPFGAPLPQVESALQDLGVRFRALAAERGLAILGSGRFGPSAYPDDPASDQILRDALGQAAALTGRPEIADAPILLYGSSGGGPEAAGFTQRNPDRVQALFLKVPASAGPLTGPALDVPAYMVLAEFDAFVDNAMLTATFRAHRAAGAPWAMALEPGVPHHSVSLAQRELTVDWMRAILPLGNAGPFRGHPATVGFLGDAATGEITPIGTYAAVGGDRAEASWFPTYPLAVQWAAFIGH